jgi:EKC/KEOPS complex subunit CGI121/TPRKB
MALKLETINIPHLPASLPVHVALYRNVQNSAFLRQQLLAGNAEFEYALIDASLVRAYTLCLTLRDNTVLIKEFRCYLGHMHWQPSFVQ